MVRAPDPVGYGLLLTLDRLLDTGTSGPPKGLGYRGLEVENMFEFPSTPAPITEN